MVEHIVCFKLKPESTPEQEEILIAMLKGLKEAIPEIITLAAGRNFTPERGQGYTVGLSVRFADRKGLEVYGPHPAHQPVRAYSTQICESILVVDVEW